MKDYKRLTTKCEVGIGLTETSGNIVNDYEKAVNRLCDLEDKIENGALKFMPCKVGDTVYFITPKQKQIQCEIIQSVSITVFNKTQLSWSIQTCQKDGHSWSYSNEFNYINYNKTFFFTEPEAEAKLRELKEKDNE